MARPVRRPARRGRRFRVFAQGAPQTHGRIRGWSCGERAFAIRQWPRLHQRQFPEGDCPDRRGLIARATISRASSSAIAMWSSTNFRGRSFVIPTRAQEKDTNTRQQFWQDRARYFIRLIYSWPGRTRFARWDALKRGPYNG